MKLLVLCFLGLVALSMAVPTSPQVPEPPPRGCRHRLGRCTKLCPEGTVEYRTIHCLPKTPEATCDKPIPVKERERLCDFSECYCVAPTVRDTKSGNCVKLEDCPRK